MLYEIDDVGWIHRRARHVFVVAVAGDRGDPAGPDGQTREGAGSDAVRAAGDGGPPGGGDRADGAGSGPGAGAPGQQRMDGVADPRAGAVPGQAGRADTSAGTGAPKAPDRPPALRLTHGDMDHDGPAWSPDGARIAFRPIAARTGTWTTSTTSTSSRPAAVRRSG